MENAARLGGPEPTWVYSNGGPLILIPTSAVGRWGGCTETGLIMGDPGTRDDYDRACEVEDAAGVIGVGADAQGLVLGDEPLMTCYLPGWRTFVRWRCADPGTDFRAAAQALLAAATLTWVNCGVWPTDGAAILMDSAEPGDAISGKLTQGPNPGWARIPTEAGRWTVRVSHGTRDGASMSLVQLLPAP